MNDISHVNGMHQLLPLAVQRRPVAEAPCDKSHRASRDEVEISGLGALLSRVGELPDLRVDRIARLRTEIENRTFETPQRLEGTVERLLEELRA